MNTEAPRPARPSLRTGEKTCWILALAGVGMALAPFLAPESFRGWNGAQFAMALIGLTLAPTMAISTLLFRRRRQLRALLADDSRLLLRWTYRPEEWRSFTEEDFERERGAKWALFRVVATVCLVIGLAFAVADWEGGGPWVLGVLAALCAVIAVTIRLTTTGQRNRRLAGSGEVRIGADGLTVAGELHVWKGFGARLETCGVVEGTPPCIEFVYSTPAKGQRQINSVRVPIPTGYEAEAAGVVARFASVLGAKK